MYIIETDASSVGVGAVLKQLQGENEVILELASRKFSETEAKWDTREQELFAVKWAIDKWRYFVGLTKFLVRTDHNNLRYLTNVDRGKVFRWAIYLSQFDFEIEFLAGDKNSIADWLSRYSAMDNDDELIDKIAWRAATVREIRPLSLPQLPTRDDFESAEYPKEGVQGCTKQGRLFCHISSGRLYVPPELRTKVLINYHYGANGHLGIVKTTRRLRKVFWWQSLQNDVADMISSCLICARVNKRTPKTVDSLPPSTLDHTTALDLVSLDHIDLEYGTRKFYFLIMNDHATRYMAATLTVDRTANTTYQAFFRDWVSYFGIPKMVLTDGGGAFKETFNIQITIVLGCKHYTTSPYTPQGNGINESSHQLLKKMMAAMWHEGRYQVDHNLRAAVSIHNTTPHTHLKVAPMKPYMVDNHITKGAKSG